MKKEIDVIICTNKNLLVLKKIVNQIFDQKGNLKIKIIIVHQSYSTMGVFSFQTLFPHL